MSTLNGRLKALERNAVRAAGCPDCGGVLLFGLGADWSWPAWLDESHCRRCGNGIKAVPQRLLDRLA